MDCPSRALVPTSQFQEESPLLAQSRSVFQSLLFDFSLGNEKLKLPPQHDTDESVSFETMFNNLWLTRLLESFPQRLTGSTTGGRIYCFSEVDKSWSQQQLWDSTYSPGLKPSLNLTVFGTKTLMLLSYTVLLTDDDDGERGLSL